MAVRVSVSSGLDTEHVCMCLLYFVRQKKSKAGKLKRIIGNSTGNGDVGLLESKLERFRI